MKNGSKSTLEIILYKKIIKMTVDILTVLLMQFYDLKDIALNTSIFVS